RPRPHGGTLTPRAGQRFHTTAVVSADPDASVFPSGLNATTSTGPRWPRSVWTGLPEAASDTRTVPAPPANPIPRPTANVLPSGPNTGVHVTRIPSVSICRTALPVVTSTASSRSSGVPTRAVVVSGAAVRYTVPYPPF